MLTRGDDFPIHQTAEPIAVAGSDRNFYDRYFFNGYAPDGDVMFAVALGVYPVLNIMDAAVICVAGDTQHNLRFSKEMNSERLDMTLGPLQLEVLEPLKKLRIRIAENEHNVHGELVCEARHEAMLEPRFVQRLGPRTLLDYTRLTQNISWSGELHVAGTTHRMTQWRGTRDRSWGVRPVGERDPQPPVPAVEPQFYWLWSPMNFDGHSLFFHSSEDVAGAPHQRESVLVIDGREERFERPTYKLQYESGTRRVRQLEMQMQNQAHKISAQLTPLGPKLYLSGLGYLHPTWGHGTHHGPLAMQYDTYGLKGLDAQLAEGKIEYLHVQAKCDVRLDLDGQRHQGLAVLEQLFLGKHEPSGFQNFLDTAR